MVSSTVSMVFNCPRCRKVQYTPVGNMFTCTCCHCDAELSVEDGKCHLLSEVLKKDAKEFANLCKQLAYKLGE